MTVKTEVRTAQVLTNLGTTNDGWCHNLWHVKQARPTTLWLETACLQLGFSVCTNLGFQSCTLPLTED